MVSLWVNVSLAFIGIGALVVYNGQLKVMRGQLDQMKGGSAQTDRLIAATNGLASAAQKAADTASEQLRATTKQLGYIQGARVTLYADFNGAEIDIVLFNDGHEAASNVRARFTVTERRVDNKAPLSDSIPFLITVPYSLTPVQDRTFWIGPTGPAWMDTHQYRREYQISFPPTNVSDRGMVELSGAMNYMDGFEDKQIPLCFRQIIRRRVDAPTSLPSSFVPCVDFESLLEAEKRNPQRR